MVIVKVNWCPEHQEYAQEVYRLLKDQEAKIFDLSYSIKNISLFDYVEYNIKNNLVFVIIDNDGVVQAFFMLDEIKFYKDAILRCSLHCAVAKRKWGKGSRYLGNAMLDYIYSNIKIKRLTANVPQHNFGVIKLLKDLGFKKEGVLKSNLIFKNKNGEEKYYDEIIYTIVREDI